jgi:plasmid stabilization system protein ParE
LKKSIKYELIIRSSADEDLSDIVLWYEKKVPGLGARFLDDFSKKLSDISDAPFNYPSKFSPFRMALVENFPYKIWFKIDDSRVIVIAVIHAFRKDENWLTRR